MQTHDELLLEVERRAPGFGGMFVDSDGKLTVYLLDTRQLPVARSAVESVFGPQSVPAAGAKAIVGQYTFSQLHTWAKNARDVLKARGVTMVDADEAKNRVAIGVENSSRSSQVEKALAARGVPRKAVLIEVTGPIKPVGQ